MEFRDFMHHRFIKGVVKDFFVLYFADLGILKNWGAQLEDSGGQQRPAESRPTLCRWRQK